MKLTMRKQASYIHIKLCKIRFLALRFMKEKTQKVSIGGKKIEKTI